jgi:hypothetical protein
MKTESSKSKRRSTLAKRLAYGAAVAMLLPVVALASLEWKPVNMVSQPDVKALAGTWGASYYPLAGPGLFEHTTLVIHKDGTYQLSGSVHSKGTIEISKNGRYIKAGPFDLWIYRTGKSLKDEVLEGDGNNGNQVAFGRVPTSMAPSAAIG